MAADKRVVAITGASSGIGRATAGLFASRGWNVGLIARGEAGLEATRQDVSGAGGRAAVAPADVSDAAALERAASQVEDELGPIEVWINVAGVSVYGAFKDVTEEEFRRVTDVTYLGAVNGTRTALRRMLPRDRGTIVTVGSAIAYRGTPLQSAYSGAKYALRGFNEAVRSELIHDGSQVHLAIVHPPSVNTPFFSHAESRMADLPRPPPPVYQPEIIADALYFAATHRRREIVVGGQSVQMQALNTVAPGVSDLLLGRFGYAAQGSRSERARALRDPNLFRPAARVHDVRGPWTAFEHSAQLWATKNRPLAMLGAGLAFGAGLLAMLAMPSRR